MDSDPTQTFGPDLGNTPRNPHAAPAGTLGTGTSVGHFRIESLLGEGGMGVVYLARQSRPNRTVALKLVRPGYATQKMLRRFEHEAEMLGRLLHPGIAQIYEAGTADLGAGPQPFFAMELVRGQPLTEYAAANLFGIRQRLELLARVCDAVEHAHVKGVIHRDLKPGNILVTADGQPKILDFGVARATDSDIQATTLRTDIGVLVGTVPYMSPEQVTGDPAELDTRSDVYALGVIAFELLTGHLPYVLERKPIHEAVRIIREGEPTRLSLINRGLRGDVETIVAHALEKDKSRRYRTASELAADIRRYLNDEPITARPASTWYQLKKFSRRNRALVGGVLASFAILLGGLGVSLYAFSQARHERDAAMVQSYVANIAAASASIQANDVAAARRRLGAAPEHLRGWEWSYLMAQSDQSIAEFIGGSDSISSISCSPDGARIALASSDKTVRVLDAVTGRELARLQGHEGPVRAVAFSPDGSRIASASQDRTLRLWDAAGGEALAVFRHDDAVVSVAFSPDGARIWSACFDKTLRVWDVASGNQVGILGPMDREPTAFALNRDGTQIAVALYDGTLRLWDVVSFSEIGALRGHENAVLSVAFSRDGTRIVSGSLDATVRVWNPGDAKEVAILRGHTGEVSSVAVSEDGNRIVSGAGDGTVRLWDIPTTRQLAVYRGHGAMVDAVVFMPGGAHIASGSSDGTIRLWPASEDAGPLVLRVPGVRGWMASAVFDRAGARIAAVAGEHTMQIARQSVRVWDASTGQETAALSVSGFPNSVAFSPDGTRIAVTGRDNMVHLRDATTGDEVLTLKGHGAQTTRAAFSPDGTRIATASYDKSVRIWDASTGQHLATLNGHEKGVDCVAISPNGELLASGSLDNTVRLWELRTGQPVATLIGHGDRVFCVAFSPDGSRLASASDDKTLRLWDVATGQELAIFRGHQNWVTSVAFSTDGRRLASGSRDSTVRIWDIASAQELLVLRGHEGAVDSVEFSPDGTRIASSSIDGTIRVWDSLPYRERLKQRKAASAPPP